MDSSQNCEATTEAVFAGDGAVIIPGNSDGRAMRAAEAAVDDSKQKMNQVINSIQKTLGLLHQLCLTVSSFNMASQTSLIHRLNSLVSELENMVKLADKCEEQVPMRVLNLIDDGRNPDELTRDVLNGCIAKNQITKGRTDAFKIFRRSLLEELELAFPAEVESYRDIRATSAVESKRFAQAQNIFPNGNVNVKSEV